MIGFLPASVVVVGSGIIAIEYARIFRTLGAAVTMVVRSSMTKALDRIGLDKDLTRILVQSLVDDGRSSCAGVLGGRSGGRCFLGGRRGRPP